MQLISAAIMNKFIHKDESQKFKFEAADWERKFNYEDGKKRNIVLYKMYEVNKRICTILI
jgi:hypothetical protein